MRQLNRGMTLIEVLVAFVLLSLSLAVIFHIFAGGMRNARLAEGYSRAVFLAESKLAAVGAEYAVVPGETHGALEPHIEWHIAIKPAEEERQPATAPLPVQRLFHVQIRVAWSEGGNMRQVELESLRLGPRT